MLVAPFPIWHRDAADAQHFVAVWFSAGIDEWRSSVCFFFWIWNLKLHDKLPLNVVSLWIYLSFDWPRTRDDLPALSDIPSFFLLSAARVAVLIPWPTFSYWVELIRIEKYCFSKNFRCWLQSNLPTQHYERRVICQDNCHCCNNLSISDSFLEFFLLSVLKEYFHRKFKKL